MKEQKISFMSKEIAFIKKNSVMCIALLAAVITSFIIPVDKEYAGCFSALFHVSL